jgi:hypothetical protein
MNTLQFGFGLVIFGAIWSGFSRAESLISEQAKRELANWLLDVDVSSKVSRWPAAFVSIFDRIFDESHFTLRCFRRSVYASLASVAILMLVWGSIRPEEFRTFLFGEFSADRNLYLLIVLMLNIIPDYLSLVQTRKFLSMLRPWNRWYQTTGILLLDLIASTVIFFVVGLSLLSAANWGRGYVTALDAGLDPLKALASISPTGKPIGAVIPIYSELVDRLLSEGLSLRTREQGVSLGTCFYSTFFTSAWLWIHALGCSAARYATRLGELVGWLRWLFDVKNSPLRVVGLFAAAAACLGYWAVAGLAGLAN